MICEVCERKESEVDALVDGEYKRMCRQCSVLEGAIVVQKPSEAQVNMTDVRPKVRQVLTRMAGLNKANYSPESSRPAVRDPYSNLRIPASRKNVSLDDLREVKRSNEAEEKAINAEVSKIEDIEAEIEENKSKVSWFGRITNMFKKQEKKEAPAGNDAEKVAKVRIIDSREDSAGI